MRKNGPLTNFYIKSGVNIVITGAGTTTTSFQNSEALQTAWRATVERVESVIKSLVANMDSDNMTDEESTQLSAAIAALKPVERLLNTFEASLDDGCNLSCCDKNKDAIGIALGNAFALVAVSQSRDPFGIYQAQSFWISLRCEELRGIIMLYLFTHIIDASLLAFSHNMLTHITDA